jgi:RIO kinase 1
MLTRDVNNLRTYFGQYAPALLETQYAEEIWSLYEHGKLNPEVELTGRFECDKPPVDLEGVMREIDDAREEEAARLLRLQELA